MGVPNSLELHLHIHQITHTRTLLYVHWFCRNNASYTHINSAFTGYLQMVVRIQWAWFGVKDRFSTHGLLTFLR